MHQTASGRWVPDKPPVSSPNGDDTGLMAVCREAMAAGIMMPWWYPLMHFEAAVGREVLRADGAQ